jgi:hypothetical protein
VHAAGERPEAPWFEPAQQHAQPPDRCHECQLAQLDAQVEAQQRERELLARQLHLGQRAREAEAFDGDHTRACANDCNLEGREGIDLWEELLQRHSNIFLVVSGHVQGVSYRQRTGNNGNLVHEILTDFQNEPVRGTGTALGNGWLRVLTFDPALNRIGQDDIDENGDFHIFARNFIF